MRKRMRALALDRCDAELAPDFAAIAEAIQSDMAIATDAIAEGLRCGSGLETAIVCLTDLDSTDARHVVRAVRTSNHQNARIELGDDLPWVRTGCQLLRDDERYASPDLQMDYPEFQPAADLGIRSFVAVPIEAGGGGPQYGTLCAYSTDRQEIPVCVPGLARLFAAQIVEIILREQRVLAQGQAIQQQDDVKAHLAAFSEQQSRVQNHVAAVSSWLMAFEDETLDVATRRAAIQMMIRRMATLRTDLDHLIASSRSHLTAAFVLGNIDIIPGVREGIARAQAQCPTAITTRLPAAARTRVDPGTVAIIVEHLIACLSADGAVAVAVAVSDGDVRVSVTGSEQPLEGIRSFGETRRNGTDMCKAGRWAALRELAQSVGASVHVDRSRAGTSVSISLPVDPGSATVFSLPAQSAAL